MHPLAQGEQGALPRSRAPIGQRQVITLPLSHTTCLPPRWSHLPVLPAVCPGHEPKAGASSGPGSAPRGREASWPLAVSAIPAHPRPASLLCEPDSWLLHPVLCLWLPHLALLCAWATRSPELSCFKSPPALGSARLAESSLLQVPLLSVPVRQALGHTHRSQRPQSDDSFILQTSVQHLLRAGHLLSVQT